jgi:regulator of replication initiation timing
MGCRGNHCSRRSAGQRNRFKLRVPRSISDCCLFSQMLRLKDQVASLTARNESLNVQMEGLRRQAAAMQSKAECSEAECMTLNKWLQQKEDALKVQQNT